MLENVSSTKKSNSKRTYSISNSQEEKCKEWRGPQNSIYDRKCRCGPEKTKCDHRLNPEASEDLSSSAVHTPKCAVAFEARTDKIEISEKMPKNKSEASLKCVPQPNCTGS